MEEYEYMVAEDKEDRQQMDSESSYKSKEEYRKK